MFLFLRLLIIGRVAWKERESLRDNIVPSVGSLSKWTSSSVLVPSGSHLEPRISSKASHVYVRGPSVGLAFAAFPSVVTGTRVRSREMRTDSHDIGCWHGRLWLSLLCHQIGHSRFSSLVVVDYPVSY